jgi:hypothetical protein
MKLSDQLFKRNLNEAEKEFTFTEFLNLVDSNTGTYRLIRPAIGPTLPYVGLKR